MVPCLKHSQSNRRCRRDSSSSHWERRSPGMKRIHCCPAAKYKRMPHSKIPLCPNSRVICLHRSYLRQIIIISICNFHFIDVTVETRRRLAIPLVSNSSRDLYNGLCPGNHFIYFHMSKGVLDLCFSNGSLQCCLLNVLFFD